MSIDELRQQASPVTMPSQHGLGGRNEAPSWVELWAAIALAGSAYVVAWVLVAFVISFFAAAVSLLAGEFPAGEEVLFAIVGVGIGCLYGGFIAFLYTAVAAAPTLAAVAGALKLLGWRPRWDRLGAFCGGLVGYVATLPLSLVVFYEGQFSWRVAIVWLLGPATAIFFGQCGGAAVGVKHYRRQRRTDDAPARHPPRFSLWQLLALMALVSIALTLLRAVGLLNAPMLMVTLAWLLVHFAGRELALSYGRFRVARNRRQVADQRRKERSARWPGG